MIANNFWSGRRVLLTGHTGFKGSWLFLWLQQLGADVFGYSLAPDSKQNLFDFVSSAYPDFLENQHCLSNLTDLDTLKDWVQFVQPDIVFHLAAQPLVRASYEDPLGTWLANVQGTLNLLESLKSLKKPCSVVLITTDKVYQNREWSYGYRETDRLGGHDPYSASKAAAEIAISSWRSSFCGNASHQTPYLRIATARAGNVIGGGDWAKDRIIPDAIQALEHGTPVPVRNPASTRPWQHVLEPLAGYLRLAEVLTSDSSPPCESFNFGPHLESNRPVSELLESILSHWPGEWVDQSDPQSPHEAGLLHLQIDKAYHYLGWTPRWNYATTVERTVTWYRNVHQGLSPLDCCIADLQAYQT